MDEPLHIQTNDPNRRLLPRSLREMTRVAAEAGSVQLYESQPENQGTKFFLVVHPVETYAEIAGVAGAYGQAVVEEGLVALSVPVGDAWNRDVEDLFNRSLTNGKPVALTGWHEELSGSFFFVMGFATEDIDKFEGLRDRVRHVGQKR